MAGKEQNGGGEDEGGVEIGGREPKTKDAVGRVRVYLSLNDAKNKPVKDNITAALYIKGAKVSDVKAKLIQTFTPAKGAPKK